MFTKAVKLTSFGGLMFAGLLANNNDSSTRNEILVENKPQPKKIELEPKKAVHNVVDKYWKTRGELVLSQIDLVTPSTQEWSRIAQEVNIRAEDLCWCEINEAGCSGMSLAISVHGKLIFHRGFCYSDLENQIFAKSSTIMRVAGADNPLVMMVLAKLWQEGKIDLDSNMSSYVPNWQEMIKMDNEEDKTVSQLIAWIFANSQKEELEESESEKSKPPNIFTLLASFVESVTGQSYTKYMESQFSVLGLQNTYIDQVNPLIYNRARHYARDKQHRLQNMPSDPAGQGVLSNAVDMVNLGNSLLYSYQTKSEEQESEENRRTPGYLDNRTLLKMLQNTNPVTNDKELKPGWTVIPRHRTGFRPQHPEPYITYTQENEGATSTLLLAPGVPCEDSRIVPRGVVVAILCNMQGIGLAKLALNIASFYHELEEEKPASLQTVYQC